MLTTLSQLLKGYVIDGWLFFVFHIIVFVAIIQTWIKIRNEANLIENWEPTSALTGTDPQSTQSKGSVVPIFNRFISETKRLSPMGLYVSLNDYIGRIDSITDSLVAELHDRTNLFLIVGIAGTLFGLFEFSYNSFRVVSDPSLVPGQRILEMGKYLSLSMSKAFPVGFFGLLFTLISQIFITGPEHRLRKGVAEATKKALGIREQVSQSQADVINKSIKAIKDGMRPLEDLRTTLSDTLQPVIEKFEQQLRTTMNLVQEQFSQLQNATNAVQGSVDAVQTGVISLKEIAQGLETILQDAPSVLKTTAQLNGKLQKSILDFEHKWQSCLEVTQTATQNFGSAAKELSEIPKSLRTQSSLSFTALSKSIKTEWDHKLEEIDQSFNSSTNAILKTSQLLQENAVSLGQVPEILKNQSEEIMASFQETSLQRWDNVSRGLQGEIQEQYLTRVISIEKETKQLLKSLTDSSTEIRKVAQEAHNLMAKSFKLAVQEVRNDVIELVKQVDHSVSSKIPQSVQSLTQLQLALNQSVSQMGKSQERLQEWLEKIEQVQNQNFDYYSQLANTQNQHFSKLLEQQQLLLQLTTQSRIPVPSSSMVQPEAVPLLVQSEEYATQSPGIEHDIQILTPIGDGRDPFSTFPVSPSAPNIIQPTELNQPQGTHPLYTPRKPELE